VNTRNAIWSVKKQFGPLGVMFGSSATSAFWSRVVLSGILLATAAGGRVPSLWAQAGPGDTADAVETKPQSIRLTVDFGNGYSVSYSELPWNSEMTVFDAMQLATKHPHPLQFDHRGKQETAFLTAIAAVGNQGAGGKNWIFKVNGKVAHQGFAVTPLIAGDDVSWHYGQGLDESAPDRVP
jgi:Domain of unknown function (DUF4430)